MRQNLKSSIDPSNLSQSSKLVKKKNSKISIDHFIMPWSIVLVH
jgi:hypothetical protein